jgi:hypothetical protein
MIASPTTNNHLKLQSQVICHHVITAFSDGNGMLSMFAQLLSSTLNALILSSTETLTEDCQALELQSLVTCQKMETNTETVTNWILLNSSLGQQLQPTMVLDQPLVELQLDLLLLAA